MTNEGVDVSKRQFLTLAATAASAVGVGFAAVPFVSSMQPSARAQAEGGPVEVDIGQLEPGQLIRVKWRGRPVWVLRRTQESLAALGSLNAELRDPLSAESSQPEAVRNEFRSIKPEILVTVGLCTHLGCVPSYRPELAPEDLGADWKGGFFCPCHGSRFDLAGRVYKGVPAPTNLEVPPHRYLSDARLMIGEEIENS